ncbi:hypothetical protein ACJW30_08G040700 [Castanea mollissima]
MTVIFLGFIKLFFHFFYHCSNYHIIIFQLFHNTQLNFPNTMEIEVGCGVVCPREELDDVIKWFQNPCYLLHSFPFLF